MRSLQSIWVFVVQSLKDSGKKAKSKDPKMATVLVSAAAILRAHQIVV